MLIAQISDTHITNDAQKACGVASTADNLAQCIRHLNGMNPQPNVALITGDITHSGLLSETQRAADLLDALEFPYLIIPGNHDDKDNLLSVFSEHTCPSTLDRFIAYAIEGYDLRLVGMDSSALGESGGVLCKRRLNWLDECIGQNVHQPTLVFMHHPPVKCGVRESDFDGFIGAEALGQIFDKYNHIERLLCGHIHLPVHVRWHGTVVSTAPSIGMRLKLDLTMKQASQFYVSAPAFQLHHWTADKILVSHVVNLDAANGPHLFDN